MNAIKKEDCVFIFQMVKIVHLKAIVSGYHFKISRNSNIDSNVTNKSISL